MGNPSWRDNGVGGLVLAADSQIKTFGVAGFACDLLLPALQGRG